MDIQSLSVGMAQNRVQEEAAIRVMSMSVQNMDDTGAEMNRLLESARPVSDPNLGNHLNTFM
jgi:uncharacterized protein YutE (UPF0331/DUF86 family)